MTVSSLWKKAAKKGMVSLLTAMIVLAFFTGVNRVLAQENTTPALPSVEEITAESVTTSMDEVAEDTVVTEAKTEASTHQTVQLQSVEEGKEWKKDSWSTGGLKFMIRGKEALAWTIDIDDAGFDNPAIQSGYNKVLTIVNSLFILGLLAIAAMWMFSLLIPRQQLKRVMLVYAMAVIFVNFALPFNRLLVDSTNLLQKTLLTQNDNPIGIVDIMEAPDYKEAIGYRNKTGLMQDTNEQSVTVTLPDATGKEIEIGTLKPDEGSPMILNGALLGEGGGSAIQLNGTSQNQKLTLNTNQSIQATMTAKTTFNPDQEQQLFSFSLMILTGIAYLMMALIFLLRIVILWGLLIVSPVLLLLAIFSTTRGYFYNWMSLYGRWLLIGPLMALGIAVIVNIWQKVGLPITSGYNGSELSTLNPLSNIRFYLPGKEMPNDLSTTAQMMEYIVFLMMLYLPIFFGFALTRQKTWQAITNTLAERLPSRKVKHEEKTETEEPKANPWVGGVKNFVGEKISKLTQTVLPSEGKKSISDLSGSGIPSASNFLPEQLSLTTLPDLLGLLGAKKESRHSQDQTLSKLAHPEQIADTKERQRIEAVKTEIETRATQGDPAAALMQSEIQNRSQSNEMTPNGMNTPEVITDVHVTQEPQGTSVIKESSDKNEKTNDNHKATPVTQKATTKPKKEENEDEGGEKETEGGDNETDHDGASPEDKTDGTENGDNNPTPNPPNTNETNG
ncbi:hypothetical protein COY07_03650 [Candidatus Peregrinibacteria bacterium CG_4_10_14_0_2_um_filter_43_11]|nr:MAG: hypothetical protein COY07_03650 [Candidatus Peregrinibacteria bacterium CG_4_10_14_0_2_um_filter_43_11]